MSGHDRTMSSYEIERKFLVHELPENIDSFPSEEISQGYLAVTDGGIEVRLRKKGQAHFMSVKSGEGMRREEIEIDLLEKQFRALWPKTAGTRVEKKRIKIPYGSTVIELDIYSGSLEGLKTAEVEFKTQDDALAFTPPKWFDREITLDDRYKNKNLAMYGLPSKPS